MSSCNDHMAKSAKTIIGSKSCYIIHNMVDIENHGRNTQWDNPVARRPSPPDKREQYVCIVCLEDCSGLERENICIVGGDCRFCAHECCIQRWFQINLTCPVCRETVVTSDAVRERPANIGIDVNDDDIDTFSVERTTGNINGNIALVTCVAFALIGLGVVVYMCST